MAQRVSRSHVTYLYPRGHLQAVIPFWNVGTPDTVAGWTPHGSDIMYWATADGRDPRSVPLDRRFAADLTSTPRTWLGTMFRLFRPDDWYQVLHFFTPEGELSHWYVDFETPKAADEYGGWTTCDLEIDLIITPDGTVRWKDEDELDAALRAGYLDSGVVDEVLPVARAIYADPDRFIRELPDWRGFLGPEGLEPLPLPVEDAWSRLMG